MNKIQEEEKRIEQEQYPVDDDEKKKPQPMKAHEHYYYFAFLAFMIIILLQAGVCSITKRVGVSIIWFALDGWVMRDILRRQYKVDDKEVKFIAFFSAVTLVDGAVVVYYFFTDIPMVTAARVFAHFSGAILSQFSLTCFFKVGAKRGDDLASTVDSETNSANDDLESGSSNDDLESGSIRSDNDDSITDARKDDIVIEEGDECEEGSCDESN